MRVLLDENLPHDLIDALLKRASGLIDAFVTIDGNLQYQQNVSVLPFGIVVVEPRRIA